MPMGNLPGGGGIVELRYEYFLQAVGCQSFQKLWPEPPQNETFIGQSSLSACRQEIRYELPLPICREATI